MNEIYKNEMKKKLVFPQLFESVENFHTRAMWIVNKNSGQNFLK